MSNDLMATERLVADVAALRVVVQRLLYQIAAQAGDPTEILPREQASALLDLAKVAFVGADPGRDAEIRSHAQRVLGEIHTAMLPKKFE
jgi:hypothetical protein